MGRDRRNDSHDSHSYDQHGHDRQNRAYTTADEVEKIDLFEMLATFHMGLRRVWSLILALTLICGAAGYYRSYRSYSPQYVSEASFTARASYGGEEKDYQNIRAASELAKVFPYLLTSTQLSDLVAEALDLTSLPANIQASAIENTNLFHLTVTANDAEMAYKVLNAVIEYYPAIAEKVIGSTEIEMISAPVLAERPINAMSGKRNAVLYAMAGLILGCALAFFYGLSRQVVKNENSLKAFTQLKCLGTIEQVRMKKHRRIQEGYHFINSKTADYAFKESYRSISYRLERYMKQDQAKALLVTSTLAGEGKSTSSINLALAMCGGGDKKVILIDGDLRKPSITRALLGEEKPEAAIYDVLEGRLSLEEALIPWGSSGLYLLAGDGRTFRQASEIASSSRMKQLIEEAKTAGDYVIIDSSPMDMMADAYSIGHYVDGMVMIVRYAYANRGYILNAMDRLSASGSKLYGYLINGAEKSTTEGRRGYYGSYYGSYYSKQE